MSVRLDRHLPPLLLLLLELLDHFDRDPVPELVGHGFLLIIDRIDIRVQGVKGIRNGVPERFSIRIGFGDIEALRRAGDLVAQTVVHVDLIGEAWVVLGKCRVPDLIHRFQLVIRHEQRVASVGQEGRRGRFVHRTSAGSARFEIAPDDIVNDEEPKT